MTMNNCATCRHWKNLDEWDISRGTGMRRCMNIPMFWDATEWNENGDGRRFLEQYKDIKAFAQDGSDYFAQLLTMPDFGCVSYEVASTPFAAATNEE